ncbi:50S ribosomal protein L11 methyltransferase [Oceanivirga salmonicida]|uniref:50S ribosomal protein L11 methyltransferase n=1 Tax=Oceanivirga salmonicida TaxID=1769291 RepID=UPI0008329271|nr:50S ribosomal protein L11 methyltransferase [Oceanivirga salmonicida]
MILKKIMLRYYSDDLEKTKSYIVNVLGNYGIFELELLEDFTHNDLDYDETKSYSKDLWTIIFYLPNNRFLDKKINQINLDLMESKDYFIYEIYTTDLDTDSYKDEWKKSFGTTKITDKIVINPSWLTYDAKDDEIVIQIDPSMAFGTGTHETTSLCIEMLEKYKDDKKSLLDIGCGSGILMLVAKKLGIDKVTGIDIDKNCYEVVNKNFKDNNLDKFDIQIGNLVDKINDKYDIIVSNILVDVLEKLLLDIKKVLKNGSIVIFSGILSEKETGFIKKASSINLKLIDKKYKDKWVSLVFMNEEK